MSSRRDFIRTALACTGAAAFGTASGAAAALHWPPYRDTLAIDGESAISILYGSGDPTQDSKDIAAVRASGLGAIFATVGADAPNWFTDAGFAATKKVIATCVQNIAQRPELFLLVENAADLQRARHERRLGVILQFQGTESLGGDLDRITLFRKLGLRVIQLTHNWRNLVGDGCMESGNAGLSRFGHQVVERLNAENIVVDLAHGSQRTIAEGIVASKAPVLISHTGCRALSDLPRNTGDAELRAMAARGGVAGIIFWPYLRTDTQPMAIDVIRHIEHAIDVCGEEHVGIGTDGFIDPIERTPQFEKENREQMVQMIETGAFGTPRTPDVYTFIPDLNAANRFERLAAMLSARGHPDARIAKILGGNFARVLGQVWG